MALTVKTKFRNCIIILICLVFPFGIFGHAILVTSTPKANETITGPKITLALTFNLKIDQARSVLLLEQSGRSTAKVAINRDLSSPEKLTGTCPRLAPGMYKLHWQVLAVDGHITRGEFAFQVK